MGRGRPAATRSAQTGGSPGRLLLVLVACALAGGCAVWLTLRTAARLPLPIRVLAARDSLRAADERALEADSAARDTRRTWQIAQVLVVHALQPERAVNESGFAQECAKVTAPLGRLQLALARLLAAERSAAPGADAWARTAPLLEQLRSADLDHGLARATARAAAVHEANGLPPGLARELAERYLGVTRNLVAAHGPFLQWAVELLDRAGAEAAQAELADAVATQLLHQWVLALGPLSLRLLAADLLARRLAGRAGAEAVRAELLAFRARYREACAARPVATLAIQTRPVLTAEHDRYFAGLALLSWLVSAGAGAAVFAIVLAGYALRRGLLGARGTRAGICGLAAAVVLAALGAVLVTAQFDFFERDFRGDFSRLQYWWWHVPGALALTAGTLLLASRFVRLAGVRRLAATAWWTTLFLALGVVGVSLLVESRRAAYDSALAAACDDPYGALTGSPIEAALPLTRAWRP